MRLPRVTPFRCTWIRGVKTVKSSTHSTTTCTPIVQGPRVWRRCVGQGPPWGRRGRQMCHEPSSRRAGRLLPAGDAARKVGTRPRICAYRAPPPRSRKPATRVATASHVTGSCTHNYHVSGRGSSSCSQAGATSPSASRLLAAAAACLSGRPSCLRCLIAASDTRRPSSSRGSLFRAISCWRCRCVSAARTSRVS